MEQRCKLNTPTEEKGQAKERSFDRARMDALPQEMTDRAQWVCWRNNNGNKEPINPHTGNLASSTNPKTWADVETAVSRFESDPQLSGIGFVFAEDDGLVGIDLDKCMDDQGQLLPWAAEIARQNETYCETSPSGKGVHIIGKGVVPLGQGRKRDNIEVYDRGRYFTVTGNSRSSWTSCEDIQAGVDLVIESMGGPVRRDKEQWRSVQIVVDRERQPPMAKCEALKEIDRKFKQSFDRTRQDMRDSSPSAYDMSLATIAAGAGWSDQEICDLLVYTRVKHGDEVKRKDYFQRTVFNCRTDSDTFNGIDTIAAGHVDQDNALELLSKATNLNIESITQEGRAESEWFVKLAGEEMPFALGNTQEMQRMATWNCLMIERGAGTLKVSKKQWPKFIEAVQSVATRKENPRMEFAGLIKSCLEQYIQTNGNEPVEEDEESFNDQFQRSRPFIDFDKCLNISAEGLRRFILQNGDKQSQKRIYAALRQLGFDTKQVCKWVDKKPVTRNYWFSKPNYLIGPNW